MTTLLYALGLSLSDQPTESVRYVPVKTYSFPVGPELEEAKRRCELISLLAESIEASARHEVNRKIEQRIQKLLKELKKEK